MTPDCVSFKPNIRENKTGPNSETVAEVSPHFVLIELVAQQEILRHYMNVYFSMALNVFSSPSLQYR
jgi:hypothetical protein